MDKAIIILGIQDNIKMGDYHSYVIRRNVTIKAIKTYRDRFEIITETETLILPKIDGARLEIRYER